MWPTQWTTTQSSRCMPCSLVHVCLSFLRVTPTLFSSGIAEVMDVMEGYLVTASFWPYVRLQIIIQNLFGGLSFDASQLAYGEKRPLTCCNVELSQLLILACNLLQPMQSNRFHLMVPEHDITPKPKVFFATAFRNLFVLEDINMLFIFVLFIFISCGEHDIQHVREEQH